MSFQRFERLLADWCDLLHQPARIGGLIFPARHLEILCETLKPDGAETA